ncbi:MAG: ATP-binding cassette domain-containing protein [Alphaproteobacteria bacterium]|nr:ATP-binding cassette domain-containing protein [Alphaproteobacteria bacterium]
MISLEHVAVEYTPEAPVLKDVSFRLLPGSFHFLTGASGAGKSTLLALLSLRLRAARGNLRMFGEDVTFLGRELLPGYRRRIGIVQQDYGLLEHLTVAENVALPLKIAGERSAEMEPKVRELLEWVELSQYYDDKPRVLSGGQKQRVAIARAVINKPDILLADEPTGNLDSELAVKFMYLFEALNQWGTTILFATHDETLIGKFDYPVLKLRHGKVQQA